MQLFTYKKEGISDLELFVDRVKEQGQFFLCDFRSDSMKEWEALGFNWKVSYRFLGEAISLADMTESDLHIYEGEKEISSYESPKPVSISSVVDPTDGGTVSPNPVTGKTGDTVTVTAKPASGYEFEKWVISGTEYKNNPQSVKLTEDMTIKAVFAKKVYTISSVVDPTGGGTLSNNAAEQGTLYYGTEVTFTATPAEGYAFLKFIINNGNETTENPYTHTMKSNVTIRCLFEKASTEEETE